MTALDDAEAGAAEQHQDGRDDAGAVRKITLEQQRSAGADRFAVVTGAAWRRLGVQPRRSRNSTAAPMAAAFRSAWGLSDLSDRARRPPPSIARARQMLCPQTLASSGTSDVSVMPGWVADLKAKEATCSLDALVEAEIRTAHAPAAKRHMRRQR